MKTLLASQATIDRPNVIMTQAAIDRDCLDRAFNVIEDGKVLVDVRDMKRLKLGFDVCMYVGHRLKLNLMDRLGADFEKHFPATMNPIKARELIGAGGCLELWEAWSRLARMRAYVRGRA